MAGIQRVDPTDPRRFAPIAVKYFDMEILPAQIVTGDDAAKMPYNLWTTTAARRSIIMKAKICLLILVALFAPLGLAQNKANLQFASEVPKDVKQQTLKDLGFVNSVRLSNASKLHHEIFAASAGSDYLQWFGARIFRFGYQANAGGGVAFVDSYQDPHKMMVSDLYAKGDLPQVARVLILFHEARHSEPENDHWVHTNCPEPFLDDQGKDRKSIFSGLSLAGEPACDSYALGAYGTASIMLNNISRFCSGCSEKVKLDAQIYSDDQALRITDRPERAKLLKDMAR